MNTQKIRFVTESGDGGEVPEAEVRQEILDCGGCGVYYDRDEGKVKAMYCDNHEETDNETY